MADDIKAQKGLVTFAAALDTEADDCTPVNLTPCHYCGGTTVNIPECNAPTVVELRARHDVFAHHCVTSGNPAKPIWVWCPWEWG